MHPTAVVLVSRLTEVEKIKIRMITTEDALVGIYHQLFKPELPGGAIHGGSEQEGIEAMREVHAKLNADFEKAGSSNVFGATWAF